MTTFLHDVRLALRSLARRPLFASVVLFTLALGIGATTAIVSVARGALFRPLPYRDPGRLAMIWSRWTNFEKPWISSPEYFEYVHQDALFSDVAAWSPNSNVALTGDGAPESVETANATRNLFDVLGVQFARGRPMSAEEDIPNGPRVAVITHELWQRRYAGDAALVGKAILLDGTAFTVVGILPRGFRLPLEFQSRTRAEIITPLGFDPATQNNGHGYFGVARLRPGVTAAQATAALHALAERLKTDPRGSWPPCMQFTAFAVPMAEEVSGSVRPALMILLGAVALLLLLGSTNVANLLLTRADSRDREMAVRAALGAGRRRMLQSSLAESLGLALAWGGVRALSVIAAASIPRADEMGIDMAVLSFTLFVSLATGLFFGAVPAIRAARVDLATSLREGGRGGSAGRERLRGRAVLVATEMAIAVVLVIGAGLLVRSFRNLSQLNPGFDPHGVITMRMSLPAASYAAIPELVRFYDELGNDVRRPPGVAASGFVRVLPLASEIGDAGMAIEGQPVPAGEANRSADWQVVTPGYFEAMRARLVSSRFFGAGDVAEAPQVIAINETLAAQYFPNENPIGKRIKVGSPTSPWRTIVGVIGDMRHNGLTTPPKREWFIPHAQFAISWGSTRRAMTLAVRTAADPRTLVKPLQALVHAKDPELPVTDVATLEDVVAGAVRQQPFATSLMAGFALLAMVLAAVGIYGVISYSVSQRTREIGVRLALGAGSGSVRTLVIAQGMLPAAIGVGAGLAGAALLSRFAERLLFGVSALDPATFIAIPALLLLVALGSTLVPVVRATRVDLMRALRME